MRDSRRVKWLVPAGLVLVGALAVLALQRNVPPVDAPGVTPTVAVPPELISRAMAQLGAELGVPAAQVQLAAAHQVTWPDAALGCPEAGHTYIQVLTPGYRLVLQAGGQLYELHTSERPDGRIVHCPSTPSPTNGP